MEGRSFNMHGSGLPVVSRVSEPNHRGWSLARRGHKRATQGMTPRWIAAGMILFAFACLAMAFLTSCVSVPVPPFGDRIGEMGSLQFSLGVKYLPATQPDRPGDANLAFAWQKFGEAKLLKDK